MFYFKLLIISLLVITFYGLISCATESIDNQENNEQLNKTQEELVQNDTNARTGRTLVVQPRAPVFMLRHRQPLKIRARADRPSLRGKMRRVHNSLKNSQRFGYGSLKSSKYVSSSKGFDLPFSINGKGSPYRTQQSGAHPNSIHVPALSQQYIHNFKASPAFNGQVVVHPAPQIKNQQQPAAAIAAAVAAVQQDSSYPKYVKPPQQTPTTALSSQSQTQKQQQQQQQQQQHQQAQQPTLTKYPEFKQYPIPDHEKLQQHNELHDKYMQQQKFLTPKNPIAYYQLHHNQQQQQQQEQLQNYAVQQPLQYLPQTHQQKPSIPIHESAQTQTANNFNNAAFPTVASVPEKMYSVYEENDMTELQGNAYQTASHQGLDKEAQEYMRFMNTDDYFLPKKDPNYKKIDDEADKRHYNILKAQAPQHLHSLQQSPALTPYQQSLPQPAAYQQHHLYSPLLPSSYSNTLYPDTHDASAYNQRMPASRLFSKQDPSTAASSDSSTVVRTSYQAGYNQNQFFANSQDNQIGKYTTTPPTTSAANTIVLPTQSRLVYPQLRRNTVGNRTPEPLRFEFTERDAMVGASAYTSAPQGQSRYNELLSNSLTANVPKEESSTVSLVKAQNYLTSKHVVKPVAEESEDDPEDGDDVLETGAKFLGRQPLVNNEPQLNNPSASTETPPSEQKDTEEYCEHICANVEDENEEIVCGSDGYMYTSEAQMECYASCLHIDITIQGKGSCSAR